MNKNRILREVHKITPYHLKIPKPGLHAALPTVDLRPRIADFGMSVRDQGTRGTCSVFAMTGLLEYMYLSRLQGTSNNLSEEYLNYASNQVQGNFADGDFFFNLEAGYQQWGVVPEMECPYNYAGEITTLDRAVLDVGRRWTRFLADFIKPWDTSHGASSAQIDRVTSYLDRDTPVAFGGWWPEGSYATTHPVRGVEIMTTPPVSQKGTGVKDGHSVILVGYRRDANFPGGGYFVFRNSWGSDFGDAGYGYMPFDYVQTYANDLVAYTTRDLATTRLSTRCVVAQADQLDAFAADNSGAVRHAAWRAGVEDGRWRGWWPVLDGVTAGGGAISAVARTPNNLDAFVASGSDVYTSAWDASQSNGQWGGWWKVLTARVPAGSPINAVSRDPQKLDVFLTGSDRCIYTAAWDPTVTNDWRGWWRIGALTAPPGAPVDAVARTSTNLDIFVCGDDGRVHTAAWQRGVASGQWRGWWNVGSITVPAGGHVAAVTRGSQLLDIFVVASDGGIYTAAWDATQANGAWRGWWRIGSLTTTRGSRIAAVSRKANALDVFVVGPEGFIWTAAWDPTVSANWRGWWRIGTGVVQPDGGIAAVSRAAEKLDVFAVGTDGGIWTAAWDPSVSSNWRGWWRIGPEL